MTARNIRYEFLRPGQLQKEHNRCPLIFMPVGPLEYHGPHLPLGTDPINATRIAHEACLRIGKGVVLPTLYMGTERERCAWELESLGFPEDTWIVGMDFPSVTWKSHYHQEHVFGLMLASTLEILIEHAYRLIVIVNGHGALNHRATIDRVSTHYSQTSHSRVVSYLAFPAGLFRDNQVGHADRYETSMMLCHEATSEFGSTIDLSTLPERSIPIRYQEYSIVDAEGFTKNPNPDRVVRADPREADVKLGKSLVEETIGGLVAFSEKLLADL